MNSPTSPIETREWTAVDKSGWARGPWDSEPDKRQWTDPATGLDCLIVRGPSGALCGYVGVTRAHPWHEADYTDLGSSPNVHGGLTFSAPCTDHGDEASDICHVGSTNGPVWWFGFDCAHLGDQCPKTEATLRQLGHNVAYVTRKGKPIREVTHDGDGTYRTIAYVTNEVESLARQLSEVS